MRGLYFKPYACCRWSQPAVQATLGLLDEYDINPNKITQIQVHTFEEATHLNLPRPQNTEQAQYSLPYPVAAAVYSGKLEPVEVTPPAIFDERVLQLAEKVEISIDQDLNQRFPEEALSWVVINTDNGRSFTSPACSARGDPNDPLSDAELDSKFSRLVNPRLGQDRANTLHHSCWQAASLDRIGDLVELLAPPPEMV